MTPKKSDIISTRQMEKLRLMESRAAGLLATQWREPRRALLLTLATEMPGQMS